MRGERKIQSKEKYATSRERKIQRKEKYAMRRMYSGNVLEIAGTETIVGLKFSKSHK